jgi:hypothetical protein|uniref:Uncharacterized protein n=1 Tax=Myoviridae sp. ctshb19 TaxID=2825194 RepID=A0A8S5UG73_9CAUD|nr:MAG TPA: hypothetical protein [Myoviridae sp. ctshb19]
MNHEKRIVLDGMKLQEFFDIRLDDSPSKRPVNLEIQVYTHCGVLKREIVGCIRPKDNRAFDIYNPQIVANAVRGWAIHNRYADDDLGDVVKVMAYPFGSLRVENIDRFLLGRLLSLSVSVGVRVCNDGGIAAMQTPVPRNEALMAADLLALRNIYKKGPEARSLRQNFLNKWAEFIDREPEQQITFLGALLAIAESNELPLEWWPAEGGMQYHMGGYLVADAGLTIKVQAYDDLEKNFSWGELEQAINTIQEDVKRFPAIRDMVERKDTVRRDFLHKIHDKLAGLAPSHWEVLIDGARILEFRRPKTLSNNQEVVGTFTTCQDGNGNIYLVWEVRRGLVFAGTEGRHEMPEGNYIIRREFRTHNSLYGPEFEQQILRDMGEV